MKNVKNADLTYRSLIKEFKGNIRNFNRNQKKNQVKNPYDNEGYAYYSIDSRGNISTNMEDTREANEY